MNKKSYFSNPYLIAAVITFLAISAVSACKKEEPAGRITDQSAVVLYVAGTAALTRPKETAITLKTKDLLETGDVITTAKNAYVLVQIGPDILFRIQQETKVEVRALFDSKQTKLFLKNGQIIAKVRKITKDNDVVVETPTAIAAVRGTQFSLSYYTSRSVLAVKEGKVQLDTTAGAVKSKVVDGGYTLIINPGFAPRKINDFESLEIDKLDKIPFSGKDELSKDATYVLVAKGSDELNHYIEKIIKSKGGPLPRYIDEMIAQYGFISRVILYSDRSYLGAIKSRETDIVLISPDGIVRIPSNEVRTIKRLEKEE